MPTPLFQVRLDPRLKDWFKQYCSEKNLTETQVLSELMLAFALRRTDYTPAPESKEERLSVRLNDSIRSRFEGACGEYQARPADVVRDLLSALRDGSIKIDGPFLPNAFPASTKE